MAGEKHPVGYMPGYIEFFSVTYDAFSGYFTNVNCSGNWVVRWFEDLKAHAHYGNCDVVVIVLLSIMWTILRVVATRQLFEPLARKLNVQEKNCGKFPESAWKFIFYSFTWSYNLYIVVCCGRYTFFHDPLSGWHGWAEGMYIPSDIFWLYMIQCSFYLHSVYGTLFMDAWRKDSVIMLFHHFLTLALIWFSYAARYHKIGALVLLLHDVTDVELEFTKLNTYMRYRNNKKYIVHEYLANVGFLLFALSWFLFRLYWFPLKVLYTAGYGAMLRDPTYVPFWFFFNVLLWILQLMNVYWFQFIVVFLYKVATGQMTEMVDTREYDSDNASSKLQQKTAAVNGVLREQSSGMSAIMEEEKCRNGAGPDGVRMNGTSPAATAAYKRNVATQDAAAE
ncbi:PREDICTED: ceramide synthase 1-like [Priapulus caudatus]|uniref:Ceramide synthase 1-like n=1 Tax=Priapulus caudatus TaxID=37621 RepID=A0ABM1F5H3_PRICU|nr:PREDICTED: ceramide synthase 1-like [Priapulus caudatus]